MYWVIFILQCALSMPLLNSLLSHYPISPPTCELNIKTKDLWKGSKRVALGKEEQHKWKQPQPAWSKPSKWRGKKPFCYFPPYSLSVLPSACHGFCKCGVFLEKEVTPFPEIISLFGTGLNKLFRIGTTVPKPSSSPSVCTQAFPASPL